MAKYAERGGLTQSRHDFTTPMPSETRPASNFKLENIVSDGKIVNNMLHMLRFVCSKAEYPPFCPNADKTDAA
ncbi:TPA: hypothetical protein ACFMWQ_001344 [Neisseria meningitidis]|uniref:hypothetical protein n=1 Tax=Neisseria meningitidis TaxID=487 RepID=UPI0015D55A5D|nr:hypothetical protein [Neisseria meningitidis]